MNFKKPTSTHWTILGAIVFAIAFSWVAQWCIPAIFKTSNYTVSSIMDGMVFGLLFGAATFGLGLYLGLFLPWILSQKESWYAPWRVFGGVIAGVVIAYIITGQISRFLYNLDFPAYYLILLLIPALGWAGGCWESRGQKPLPSKRKRRIVGLIGLIPFGLIIFLSVKLSIPKNDFPLKGSIEIRHAWAVQKFNDDYTTAVDFVKNAPKIQEDIGDVIAVAPAVGKPNFRIVGFGDPGYASFTLEVNGEKGAGECALKVVLTYTDAKDYRKRKLITERAQWTFAGKSVQLDEEGNIDQREIEFRASQKRVEDFVGQLKDAFQKKRLSACPGAEGTGDEDLKRHHTCRGHTNRNLFNLYQNV